MLNGLSSPGLYCPLHNAYDCVCYSRGFVAQQMAQSQNIRMPLDLLCGFVSSSDIRSGTSLSICSEKKPNKLLLLLR
jgi:hypothetical protein